MRDPRDLGDATEVATDSGGSGNPPDTVVATDAGAGGARAIADLPRPGDIFGERYQILSRLGSGGMGHVFEAKHTTLGRRVAIKVLKPERSHSESHRERFLREAKSASAIIHPCVVELTDFGHTADGSPFFVMEYLEGETLGRRLRRSGPMPWSVLAPVAMQICGALEAAHTAGVIHRDIKPDNLFVIRQTTHVKVLDFGIAKAMLPGQTGKLTDAGTVVGTTDYVSPEIVRSEAADPRTDIYSLGVSLYQLISGELPFVRGSKIESLLVRLHEPPAPLPPTVPEPVAALIMRAMKVHPYERFQTARELYDAIVELLPERGPAVHEALSRSKLSSSSVQMQALGLGESGLVQGSGIARAKAPQTPSVGASGSADAAEPGTKSRWRSIVVGTVAAGLVVAAGLAFMPRHEHSSTLDPQHLASFGVLPDIIQGPGVVLDDAKIELGRVLFSDVRLSGSQDFSCATCHPLDRYGVDGRAITDGHAHQTTGRNVPTVYNVAGHFAQGWSGSTQTVEEQAPLPILNPLVMANTEAKLVATLAAVPEYREKFAAAFPDAPEPISMDNVATALGAFERTLVTPGPWDRYLAGQAEALTEQQRRGFNTFIDVGCVQCHSGVYVGAGQMQKLGLLRPWPETKDRGRIEDTQLDSDWMMFKVASLRNVAQTAPYLHNGSIEELATMVRMMAYHQLDRELDDDEVDDIVAFLGSLTGELPEQ
ncbi:MAG: cytochrome c peroxidase [Myxococcota bacterium]